MPIPKHLPKNTRCYDTLTFYNAAFNVPTLGSYDFTNTVANTGVTILEPLFPSAVYLIERVGFSATVPESAYLEAVTTQTTLSLRYLINAKAAVPRPLPLVKFTEGDPTVQFFWSQVSRRADKLIGDFRGVLSQPASLIGVASIRVAVAMRIYEVIDTRWVKQFKSDQEMRV